MNQSISASDGYPFECGNNMLDYKKTRRIRVFVSSTFTDMEEERETLARFVFPEVRRYAYRFGIDFDFVDLRWGITEEEVQEGKVIELCLRNIDNCRPLFLGILGEYSGWIPEKSELEKNPNLQQFFPWISGMLGNTSMTALEIYYGALRYHSHSLFLIRDNIGGASESQLKLFSEVRQSYPDSSYSYTDLGEFGQKVKDFIFNFIDSEFPHNAWTLKDQYVMENTSMLNRLLSRYVGRDRYEKPINDILENDDYQLLILAGEKGVGKKNMCAYIVGQCLSKGVKCLFDFVGDNGQIKQWHQQMYEEMVESGEKGVIVLAIADFIVTGDNESIVMDWLKNPKKNIKIILATSDPNYIIARIGSRMTMFPTVVKHPGARSIESGQPSENSVHTSDNAFCNEKVIYIDKFNDEEASAFIVKRLGNTSKSLPIRLVEKILTNKVYRLPQYLDYLVDELIMYGSHDSLEDFLDYFIDNAEFDTRDSCNYIANKVFDGSEDKHNSHMELAVAYHDKVLGDGLCSRICEFILGIGGYVEERAIKHCLGLSNYDWARFVNSFSRYLCFSNMGVRLEEYYYIPSSSLSKISHNDKLLEYYEMTPSKFRKGIIDVCLNSNDKHNMLKKYISNPENYTSRAYMSSMRMGWKCLLNWEKDPEIFNTLGLARELKDYEKNGYMSLAYAMLCDYFPEQINLILITAVELSMYVTPKESVNLLYNMKKVADLEICKDVLDILRIRFDGAEENSFIHSYLQFNELLLELLDNDNQETIVAFIEETKKILRDIDINREVPPLALVDILFYRGNMLCGLGKNEEAIKELDNALFFATEGVDVVNIHLLIAEAKRRRGDVQGGIDEIDMAVSYMSELKLSSKDYEWNSTIAEFYEKIGEKSASRYYLQQAYRAATIFYGNNSVKAGEMCKKLAEVNQDLEDYNAAIGFYNKYIQFMYDGAIEYDICDARMNLVDCLNHIEKFSDILKVYSAMPSDYRINEIITSCDVFNYYIRIAFAAYNLHEYDTALTVLAKMLSALDGDSEELDTVKFLLMLCNMRTGNLAAAKSRALEMTEILLERKEKDSTADYEEAEKLIYTVLETIEKCENGDINWDDTSYAIRKVCKEWIEECDYATVKYSYFRLENYRSKYDSNIGDEWVSPTSTFVGAEIITKQNEIIDSWKNCWGSNGV